MKDKILYLILGILIGAVITAGCFLLFSKNNDDKRMMNGERPDMSERGDRGERGEMPPDMGNMIKPDDGTAIESPANDDTGAVNEVNQ